MKNFFIPCIALLLSTACAQQEQKAQDQKAEDHATLVEAQGLQNTNPSFTDLTLDDEVLLKTFYGTAKRDGASGKFSSVLSLPLQITFRPETQGLIEASEDESIEIYVSDKKYYGTENEFCLCVMDGSIKGNDCHPCGGVLGMFILKKNDKGKWDCISHNYDVRLQGSYGSISTDPVIREISTGVYAADVSSGYSAFGCSFQNEYNFIILDGSYKAIDVGNPEKDEDAFYFDNSGACDAENTEIPPCYEFSSDISFDPSDKRYGNLRIITKGTKQEEGDTTHKTVPYFRERIYQWKDDKYILASDNQEKY